MTISDDIVGLAANISRLNTILEGGENTTVTMASGAIKPSLSKAFLDSTIGFVDSGFDVTMVEGKYINYSTGTLVTSATSHYIKIPITGDEWKIAISAVTNGAVNALATYFDTNGVYIGYEQRGVNGVDNTFVDFILSVPDSARYIGFSGPISRGVPTYKVSAPLQIAEIQAAITALQINSRNYWYGKKIVWFGTSIPEGSGGNSYPAKIASLLGATVINEAKGSSMARNGVSTNVNTVTDPYGWGGRAWQNIAYCFSADLAEKQYLIDNWATVRTTLTNTPPKTLDSTTQTLILDCSWEHRIGRHLGDNAADLYVFDHGHNDNIGTDIVTVPADSLDKGYFLGAMAYLIDKILADNPKARIAFIGHYEDSRKTNVSVAQNILASQFDFPFLKLWEKLGWSQKTTLVDTVEKTMTEIWMPDDLHPASDTTGGATTFIAEVIAAWLKTVR